MKKVELYILKEIAAPFSLGILVYTATLLVNNILRLAKLLISKGVTLDIVINLLFLMLPDMLSFTIPMSVLLGIIAGLSRMSSDSEILALKTLGFSYGQIIRPIIIFSILAMLLTAFITMEVAPEANYQLSSLLNRVSTSQSVVDIKAGIFYNELPFMHLYIKEINKNGEWRNVLLYVMKKPQDDVLITARRGRIVNFIQQNQTYIILYDGIMHTYKQKKPQEYTLTYFQERREKIERGTWINPPRRFSQLKWNALLEEKRRDPKNIFIQTEFHNKLALPAACLILGFLALPLGISTKRGGKSSGFVISLIIILVYYILLTSGRNFILEKHLPPWLGVWLANIFIFAIAVIVNIFFALEIHLNPERWRNFFQRRFRKREEKKYLFKLKIELPKIRLLKTLTSYVMRRVIFFAFLFFIALLFIYYLLSFIDLLDNAIENKTPLINIFYYNYHLTPEIALSIIPIALLSAALLTFSLMSKHNELTAIRVSGINLFHLIGVTILLAFLVSLGCFVLQEKVLSSSSAKAFYYYNLIHNRQQEVSWEYQRNWLFTDKNNMIFYHFYDKKLNRFSNFNLLYFDEELNLKKRIYAERAFLNNGMLIMEKGFERQWQETEEKIFLPRAFSTFKKLRLKTDLKQQDFFKKESFSTGYMNIRELKRYISYLRSKESDVTRYLSQLYFNYVYPFTTFILVLIALPFSFMMGKKGTLAGMGIAVTIAVSYWTLLGVFNSLGSIGVLPPLLANLIIPVTYGGISLFMILKLPR